MTGGPRPVVERVVVLGNERIADGVGLLTLRAPRIAHSVSPGQFVHLRIGAGRPEILRRPFSVHRASGERIEILYQVLGAGTTRLARAGDGDEELDAVGPLGHGWDIAPDVSHALVVTGGLGAAPMGMLVERLAERGVATVVAMGAPTAERLVARELFERLARAVVLSTDDGTAGRKGFVTALSGELLARGGFDVVFTCGPEQMQRVVARQARDAGVSCQVSLERLMACGIGACLSCVVTTSTGRKRACVEGPVFDAEEVVWDASEVPPKH